ncbi:MAG: nickel pincer cofactor biosynthesis protein LarC [Deltaproteobacteria bacterium]|nr:nickel pincer cofactor biosynthesis protein LarC [Deltaproteobacteria bacterium]MBW2138182.1 nickel pincer cofactor biosynthesis protein LarC [Deltaproteobacteria bacterium]
MKLAYLDCFSGISGDMFLGALIDLGLPLEELEQALLSLPIKGYTLTATKEERNHVQGTRFVVEYERRGQEMRDFEAIRDLIMASSLGPGVKERSIRVFEAIAREEGTIHNAPPERVHFHEVGALDSIIDIVGSVFGIEYLGISSLHSSSLPLGSGFVETQHGRLPNPAPATVALLRGVPVHDSGLHEELVTPTGAALVKVLADSWGHMPPMKVDGVGYGVGKRELKDRPNLLRIITGDPLDTVSEETILVMEASLDDTNPEWLGYLMDRLLGAGALDVLFIPVHMKKNRPGTVLQVIAEPGLRDTLAGIVFEESTTLGLRFRYTERMVLERSLVDIESPWGPMKAKVVTLPDGTRRTLPEYESSREIAEANNLPLKEVYQWVLSATKGD